MDHYFGDTLDFNLDDTLDEIEQEKKKNRIEERYMVYKKWVWKNTQWNYTKFKGRFKCARMDVTTEEEIIKNFNRFCKQYYKYKNSFDIKKYFGECADQLVQEDNKQTDNPATVDGMGLGAQ